MHRYNSYTSCWSESQNDLSSMAHRYRDVALLLRVVFLYT